MMTMASSEHDQQKEDQGGFTLLQEDNLDDRPCAAVKNFVSSVLNKKDIKDQEVGATFRRLVEYRDGRRSRSPPDFFQPIREEQNLGLLSPPSSPSPPAALGNESAERLPNKLLDELYEDIGMKSGDQVDLDFVEYLMEHNDDSQSFLTAEGMSGGAAHLGCSGRNVSTASSNISTPSNSSGQNGFVSGTMYGAEWQNMSQNGSLIPASAGGNTALSSTSTSPVRKKIHLSTSEQNSPKMLQQQQEQQQSYQQQPHNSCILPSSSCLGQEFKLPLTPLTPLQFDLGGQDVSGKVQESAANISGAVMPVPSSRASCFSPRQTVEVTEGLESGSVNSGGCGSGAQTNHKTPARYVSGTLYYSPVPSTPPTGQSVVDHTQQGMRRNASASNHRHHRHHHHLQQQQSPLQVDLQHHPGPCFGRQQHHKSTESLYHKPYKPPAPVNNMSTATQTRWRLPSATTPGQKLHHQQIRGSGKGTQLENSHSVAGCAQSVGSVTNEFSRKESAGCSAQNDGYALSELNRNAHCAPSPGYHSVTIPSSKTHTDLSTSVPQTVTTVRSCGFQPINSNGNVSRGSQPMALKSTETTHQNFLDTTLLSASGHKNMQDYTHYSNNQPPCADSASAVVEKSYTQGRQQLGHDPQSVVVPYTTLSGCALPTPPPSNSLDSGSLSSHSSTGYPIKAPAVCNSDVKVSVVSSGSVPSSAYAVSNQNGKWVNNGKVHYPTTMQSGTNFNVSQCADISTQQSLHANAYSQQHRAHVGEPYSVHVPGQNSQHISKTLDGSYVPNVNHVPNTSHNSYVQNTSSSSHAPNTNHSSYARNTNHSAHESDTSHSLYASNSNHCSYAPSTSYNSYTPNTKSISSNNRRNPPVSQIHCVLQDQGQMTNDVNRLQQQQMNAKQQPQMIKQALNTPQPYQQYRHGSDSFYTYGVPIEPPQNLYGNAHGNSGEQDSLSAQNLRPELNTHGQNLNRSIKDQQGLNTKSNTQERLNSEQNRSMSAQPDLNISMNPQQINMNTSMKTQQHVHVNTTNTQQIVNPPQQVSMNTSMSAQQHVRVNTMNTSQQMVNPGSNDSMPPPPSPVGFQPSAISTPVAQIRHRYRPPSQGGNYSRISAGGEHVNNCDGQYCNGNVEGPAQDFVPQLHDSVISSAAGGCPPSWNKPPHSRHFPHPAQMKQPSSYPVPPQQPPESPGIQSHQQLPSPCPMQSQQPSQQVPSPRPMHSHQSSFSHSVPSHQHSSSYDLQNGHLPSTHTLQSPHPSQQNSHTQQCSHSRTPQALLQINEQSSSLHHPYQDCNSTNLNVGSHLGPASRAFSMKQKFIQNLILDERNSAYRSHPLFPLLRDLVIAGMNFDDPRFHYQPLLSMLPHDFERLLQNFLQRNPPSGDYQSNFSVESVLMDSLRVAHGSLVEKICARQKEDESKALASSMQVMDEFCDRFDQTHVVGMGGANGTVNGHRPMMAVPGQMGNPVMQPPPVHIMTPVGGQTKFMVTLSEGEIMGPMMLHTVNEAGDILGVEGSPYVGTLKSESKKHPSLPKEAVSRMMDWLKEHKDNPYPNDDEKTELMKHTGLSLNQINYWFTNARRRILPKWSRAAANESNNT